MATTFEDTPQHVAAMLSIDSETAERVLQLLDSAESFPAAPWVQDDLLPDLGFEDGQKKSIIRTVIEWIQRMLNYLTDQLGRSELAIRYVKQNATRLLNAEPESSNQFGKDPVIKVTNNIRALTVRYKPVKDIAALQKGLTTLSGVLKDYYAYNNEDLVRVSERLLRNQSAIASFAPSLLGYSPKVLTTKPSFKRDPSSENTFISPQLLDSHYIRIQLSTLGDDIDNVVRTEIQLVNAEDTEPDLPKAFGVHRFSQNVFQNCLNQVIEICDFLLEINTSQSRKFRGEQLKKLNQYLERLETVVQGADNPDLALKENRKAVQAVRQYIEWCMQPYRELYVSTARILRATVNVCKANNAN